MTALIILGIDDSDAFIDSVNTWIINDENMYEQPSDFFCDPLFIDSPAGPLLKNIFNSQQKCTMNDTRESRIEDIIFKYWCQLNVSKSKIRILYELINEAIHILVPQQPSIPIPRNGQDVVRKYCNTHSEMPIYKNIYICKTCNSFLGYNTGRNLLKPIRVTCHREECDNTIGTKISIVPLIPRIRYLLSSKDLIQDISFYDKNEIFSVLSLGQQNSENIPLYMSGGNYRRCIESVINNGDIFLVFSLTCDGISPFSNPVSNDNASSFPILLKLLNYNTNRKIDTRSYWPYCITNESYSNVVLDIIAKEFKLLSSGIIMDVYTNGHIESKRVVAILLNIYGDCAAITQVASFTGSSSLFPCRNCELQWDRKNETFHSGIKCSYNKIKQYISLDTETGNIITVSYPSFSRINTYSATSSISSQIDQCNISSQIVLNNISSKYLYKDAINNNDYPIRTKESIIQNRNECVKDKSVKGVKQVPGVFESLFYFDAATFYSIDIMHLFNNIATLLLSLLFHYNSNTYISILSKNKKINPENTLKKLYLSKENILILQTRIQGINTLYNKNEYEFRYILDEKKFNHMSSHTRIFFISYILPLITYGFTVKDSPIVLLISPFATVVRQIQRYNGNTENHLLQVLKDQCFLFCFLCELLLPRELINSQIHLIQHLHLTIQNVGSLQYGSTYESERYYSFLKRSTFGRQHFNNSCIVFIIEKEVISISSNTVSIPDHINDSQVSIEDRSAENDNISDYNYINYQEDNIQGFKEININKGSIHMIKGIRAMDRMELSELEIKDVLKILIHSNNHIINRLLFKNININNIEAVLEETNNEDVFHSLVNNFRNIETYFYSEIIINRYKIFSSSSEDEGVEQRDNSYIMYITNDINGKSEIHLIKALYYLQIGNLILIRKHEYPLAHESMTNLYYIIKDSNRIMSRENKFSSSFLSIVDIVPENIIIADIHEDKHNIVNESFETELNQGKQRKKENHTVQGNSVTTNTVFMARYESYI
ncbi:hypothetical protein WA158_003455 [Blastocystis sp. Blastoise]